MRRAWRRWWVRAIVYALVIVPPCLLLLAAYTSRPNDGGPLPTVAGYSDSSRVEPDLSRVVRELAGKGEVRCWSDSDWKKRRDELDSFARRLFGTRLTDHHQLNGYVTPGTDRVNLPNWVCNDLVLIAAEEAPDEWMVYSARVFAHELIHLEGEEDEAKASCYGLQTVERVARALGSSDAYATQLAQLAWEQYPSQPGCHDGGELDLYPKSGLWP